MCILESISYTRKDGQFLRWDYRSNRKNGNNSFNKGEILSFDQAIKNKLKEMIHDMSEDSQNMDLFSYMEENIEQRKNSFVEGVLFKLTFKYTK